MFRQPVGEALNFRAAGSDVHQHVFKRTQGVHQFEDADPRTFEEVCLAMLPAPEAFPLKIGTRIFRRYWHPETRPRTPFRQGEVNGNPARAEGFLAPFDAPGVTPGSRSRTRRGDLETTRRSEVVGTAAPEFGKFPAVLDKPRRRRVILDGDTVGCAKLKRRSHSLAG